MTKQVAQELAEHRADNLKLREALEESIQLIADWASYASEYFQNKHDLIGDIDRLQKVLSGTPEQSLKEIKAAAIKDAADNCPFYSVQNEPAIMRSDLIEYANNPRGKQ